MSGASAVVSALAYSTPSRSRSTLARPGASAVSKTRSSSMARSLAPEVDENGACCRTGTVDRVTWVGHSTALVQLDGTRLLTDPLLRGRLLHLRRRTPPPSPEATARIDAVLVSHMHGDHMDLGSLRRIDRGTRLIVPRGAAAFLRAHGLPGAEEIAVGETIEVGALKVTAV